MRHPPLALLLTLSACEIGPTLQDAPTVSDTVAEPVESVCPPVSSNRPLVTGDIVTDDLRALTVDNGIIRVRYGAHAMDFRDTGVLFENTERGLDHVLAGRHTDHPSVNEADGCVSAACHSGGTHWHDAVYTWYGDGSTYSSGAPADADRIRVLAASPDAIELSYEWDEVRLDRLRSPEYCLLGNYPECGPTSRDHEGQPIWIRGLNDVVKSVKRVRLWKVIRVERCSPGYYVSMRSDPPLVWDEQGSRALRLGYVTTVSAWTCDGQTVVHHPNSGFHADLGVTDCIADVPDQSPGTHEDWPFIRFMRTSRPMRFLSLQYSPTQLGSPGAHDIWDVPGPDGRPVQWQAFIGAVEYTSPDESAEPTPQARALLGDVLENVRLQ